MRKKDEYRNPYIKNYLRYSQWDRGESVTYRKDTRKEQSPLIERFDLLESYLIEMDCFVSKNASLLLNFPWIKITQSFQIEKNIVSGAYPFQTVDPFGNSSIRNSREDQTYYCLWKAMGAIINVSLNLDLTGNINLKNRLEAYLQRPHISAHGPLGSLPVTISSQQQVSYGVQSTPGSTGILPLDYIAVLQGSVSYSSVTPSGYEGLELNLTGEDNPVSHKRKRDAIGIHPLQNSDANNEKEVNKHFNILDENEAYVGPKRPKTTVTDKTMVVALNAPFRTPETIGASSTQAPNGRGAHPTLDKSFKRFRGGIASKYLADAPNPRQPIPQALQPNRPGFQDYHFLSVHRLNTAAPLCRKNILNSSGWHGYLLTCNPDANPTTITTFICAGRKANALIPQFTQGRGALICTEEEVPEVVPHLSNALDILVVTQLDSRYNGNYQGLLSTITARRLAAFLFAFHFKLDAFLLLDDNIEKIGINESILTNPSWDDLFTLLKNQLPDQGCISVATQGGRSKAADELGSKFFMINMAAIRAHIKNEEELFLLFPEAAQAKKCCEDYYFQIFCEYLLETTYQKGYGVLPVNDIHLIRSKQHRNVCAASGIKALPFDQREYLEHIPLLLLTCVNRTILSLNSLIEDNYEQHNYSSMLLQRLNLLNVHAKAHRTEQSIRGFVPPLFIRGKNFKENFYNFITQYDYSKSFLRDYQVEAIKTAAEKYKYPSRILMATGSGKTIIQSTWALMAWHAAVDNQHVFIVTPHINLVNQFYRDLLRYNKTLRERNDVLSVPNEAFLTVSSDSQSVNIELLIKNHYIKQHKAIIICCEASFHRLMEQEPSFISSASLVLFDEYHAYTSTIKQGCRLIPHSGPIVIASSATPPKQDHIQNTLFSLPLREALNGIYHASIVACSLNKDYSEENVKTFIQNLPTFLANQYHPGIEEEGRTLAETKGVIYVQSIALCDQLLAILQKAQIKAYAIHSKNNNADNEIQHFVESMEACILIAVKKLRFGFDCPDLAWEIIARQPSRAEPQQDIEQMVGRVIRLNNNKIGYVLSFRDIHNQFIAPLIEHQSKQLAFSSDFLAHEREYHIQSDGTCQIVDVDDDFDGSRAHHHSKILKVLPYSMSHLPEIKAATSITPIRSTSTFCSFFAAPPAHNNAIALFNAIVLQKKKRFDKLLVAIPKTYETSHPKIIEASGPNDQLQRHSPEELMVYDFFEQIPAVLLADQLRYSKARYWVQLLSTCSLIERYQVTLLDSFDLLWTHLPVEELRTLCHGLDLYRCPRNIEKMTRILLARFDKTYGYEIQQTDYIHDLLCHYINKCMRCIKKNEASYTPEVYQQTFSYVTSLLHEVRTTLSSANEEHEEEEESLTLTP